MICIIAGMHRSGTSLMASWLQACGLALDNGQLIPAYPDNPQGFFEDADFVRLHETSIRRCYRFSAGWKAAPRRSLTFSAPETEQARTLIQMRAARYANWGWKDPRATLFLDQWKRLLPQVRIMLVWRPCDQVVYSLLRRWWKSRTRRHYLDPFWAIRLWQAHNLLACEFAERHADDVLVLPISQVIDRDQAVLALVNSRFDAALRYTPLDDLYEPDLFNAAPPPAAIRGLCIALGCRRLERRLAALAPLAAPS
jgi:hypothetical protein